MKSKPTVFEANNHQYTALQKAKECWGRTWKNKLRFAWETGEYPASLRSYKAELQQIRNGGGPTWLTNFKFDG